MIACRRCARAALNGGSPRSWLLAQQTFQLVRVSGFGSVVGTASNTALDKERPALEVLERSDSDKKWYLRLLGFYSTESTVARQASVFVILAKEQSENPQFFQNLGLQATFQTKYMVAGLHIWIVWHRLRSLNCKEANELGVAMFDLFWEQVTKDITKMGITYMQLNKQLMELQHMFFGNARRLDKALQDNDSNEFKMALQKNIFLGEGDEDAVENLYTYVMQAMYALELLDSQAVLSGYFVWGLPPPLLKQE